MCREEFIFVCGRRSAAKLKSCSRQALVRRELSGCDEKAADTFQGSAARQDAGRATASAWIIGLERAFPILLRASSRTVLTGIQR